MRITNATITDKAREAINRNALGHAVRTSTASSLERQPWVDLPVVACVVGRVNGYLVLTDGTRIGSRRVDGRWLVDVAA